MYYCEERELTTSEHHMIASRDSEATWYAMGVLDAGGVLDRDGRTYRHITLAIDFGRHYGLLARGWLTGNGPTMLPGVVTAWQSYVAGRGLVLR